MKVLFNTISHHPDAIVTSRIIDLSRTYSQIFPKDVIVMLANEAAENNGQHAVNFQLLTLQKSSLKGPLKLFAEKKLLSGVKKQQPDVVITLEAFSPKKFPNQVYLASPLPGPMFNNEHQFLKTAGKRIRQSLENASSTLVFSELEKNALSKAFPEFANKIFCAHQIPASKFSPLAYEEKQAVKDRIAGGNEYFICMAGSDLEQITSVLKGFSGFKKWQRSGMKLAVAVPDASAESRLCVLLSSYRFKHDIAIIQTNNPDYPTTAAAAYAAILPSKYSSDFQCLFDAVHAKVPVIIPAESIYSEITGEAAFYFKFQNIEDITRVLLESFREETKRTRIVKSAENLADRFTEAKSYNGIREILHRVANGQTSH